jgi:hypothetical protein
MVYSGKTMDKSKKWDDLGWLFHFCWETSNVGWFENLRGNHSKPNGLEDHSPMKIGHLRGIYSKVERVSGHFLLPGFQLFARNHQKPS